MTTDVSKVRELVAECAIYIPFNCEGIRIAHCEDDAFYGVGEESGDEYKVT